MARRLQFNVLGNNMPINQMEPIYFLPQKNATGATRVFKSAPEPPKEPDYKGAAEQTAKGDLEAQRAATDANRLNQVTPHGSITYSRDPNAATPDQGWTQTQTLSPVQQKLLDMQNSTSLGLGALQGRGLGFVDDALSHGVKMEDLPASMVNAGQTGQDALMARFQPMMEQSRKALDNQLANQGILPGTEAYSNALRVQNQSENDMRMQAALNGISVGQNAQNQQMELRTALQNEPLNILNAVRTGSQVTNPTFSAVPLQGTSKGADYMGAANAQNQYNLGLYNSQVASANAGNGALMSGIGAAATII